MVKEEHDMWIISWQFFDKSNFGIVGAYDTEYLANKDVELLKEHGDQNKEFTVYALKVVGR